MKTYQISDDRLVVVKKNLVVIKQNDSEKSFEFTHGRLVLMHVCNMHSISLSGNCQHSLLTGLEGT